MVVNPTCIQLAYQEYGNFKNNRAIWMNPKAFTNSKHFLPRFIEDDTFVKVIKLKINLE